MYAREAVVAAIAPHNNVTQAPPDNNPESSQVNTMESLRSPEVVEEDEESPADVVDIALGGGEAPACRAEVTSTSLSINTSPEEEDANSDFCPVFAAAGPSTSSKTQSLPRGSGRVSALVGAMIASNKEFVPPDKIPEEKLPVVAAGGDEFTRMFSQDDIRMLVDLLKLAVAGRCNDKAREAVASLLQNMGGGIHGIAEMLLELSVTELEDVATNTDTSRCPPQPVIQESLHPYTDDANMSGHVRIPGAEALRIEFDRQCSTERRHDPLTITDATGRIVAIRSGREWTDWSPELRVQGDELRWKFNSDGSVNGWGWR